MATTPTDEQRVQAKAAATARYWRSNLRLTWILLLCWAVLGLGAGIIAADWLNNYNLPGTGYPLGFWFAQQGSIIGFVVLIFIYAFTMNRFDRRHRSELQQIENGKGGAS